MSSKRFRGKKARGRESKKRLSKPLVLIVCEGEKTEPKYFNGLCQSKGIVKERITVLSSKDCGGTDPKTIVQCAKERKKYAELAYDSVWCVFDRDEHTNYKEALNQAEANNFEPAFSNPCFELWYLLHFCDQTAHIERTKFRHELDKKNRLPGYEKGMDDIYPRLLDLQPQALERAKNLRRLHENNCNPQTTNPSTTVDKLVAFLNTMS